MTQFFIRYPIRRYLARSRLARLFVYVLVLSVATYAVLLATEVIKLRADLAMARLSDKSLDFYDSDLTSWYDVTMATQRQGDYKALSSDVDRVVRYFNSTYVDNVRKWVTQQSPPNFRIVQYKCDPSRRCGGLGDRIKGLVSAFYLAMLTAPAVLDCSWEQPEDLSRFFDINHAWYQIDESEYKQVLFDRKSISILDVRYIDDDAKLDRDYVKLLQSVKRHTMTRVYANSWFLVKKMNSIPSKIRNSLSANLNVLSTAALRFLFSKPQTNLEKFVKGIIDKMNSGSGYVIKLGVQLQCNQMKSVACFAEEVHRFALDKYRKNQSPNRSASDIHFSIFVASDCEETANSFHHQFARFGKSPVASRSQIYAVNGTIPHLDEPSTPTGSTKMWQSSAKMWSDWLILSRMDHLVVGPGGFAETAAILAAKPTWRFLQKKSYSTGNCAFEAVNMFDEADTGNVRVDKI